MPEKGAFFAAVGIFVVKGHPVQAVGLFCRPCSSLLPENTVTYTLTKHGAVRVNRPAGDPR